MREIIENKTFDEERALYNSDGLLLKSCRFDGPADGEMIDTDLSFEKSEVEATLTAQRAYSSGLRAGPLGRALLLTMGLGLLSKENRADTPKTQHAQGVKLFLSSFAVSITTPAAILTFLFAFSWFGLGEGMGPLDGALLVTEVFIGTHIWWFTLSAGVVALKKKMEKYSLRTIEKCFGGVLLGFSLCCP